jgi:hypothetical protein
MKCDRCGWVTIELIDYWATYNDSLCWPCMADGCCGEKPAASGTLQDYGESPPRP